MKKEITISFKNCYKKIISINATLAIEEVILIELYLNGYSQTLVSSPLLMTSEKCKEFTKKLIQHILLEQGFNPNAWTIIGRDTAVVANQTNDEHFIISDRLI